MAETSKKTELTDRQREILNLVRKGLTNAEICYVLNISANTVKVHLANIYRILEVTNRTEAATAATEMADAPPEKKDVTLAITYSDSYRNSPLAHDLSHSVIAALRSFEVFQIQLCTEDSIPSNVTYQVSLTTPQDESQGLFVSLHLGSNNSLLWSCVQKIESSDQIPLLSDQIAIQIYRNAILSATEVYTNNPNATPKWWYASSHTIVRMENRNKEYLEKSEATQQSLLENPNHRDFVVCALACVYYASLTEHWIGSEECAIKLGKIACQTMQENPSSIYSQYTSALYNMFLGKCNVAIATFEDLLQTKSPISIVCRRLLAQLYAIVGRTEESQMQLTEYDQRVPKNIHQPFQYVADAYLAFIKRDYDRCATISEQLLMFHPEAIFGRLFMIACSYRVGKMDEHQTHVDALFEHHPGFTLKDMSPFLDVFPPTEKDHVLDCLTAFLDIFRQE